MNNILRDFGAIIQGALVTARHFWGNIFRHTLRLVGIKTRKPGAVTIQYPEEQKPLPPRHRCLHRLTVRPDGKPRCVACLLCQTVCPAECISIEAAEDPDPEVQKVPSRFTIEIDRCCFCGFCVEACPEDAIRMDSGCILMAELDHRDLIYDLERLRS